MHHKAVQSEPCNTEVLVDIKEQYNEVVSIKNVSAAVRNAGTGLGLLYRNRGSSHPEVGADEAEEA